MERKKGLIIILILFLTFVNHAQFDQMTYERRVVIKYAAPGSNPAQANGFDYTMPAKGTFQVEIIPDRVSIAIQGIPIVIDVAVGILFENPNGKLRRGSKRYTKGPWKHGIGNAFVSFKATKGQQIRTWYSASVGGMPCPNVWGKVRIFRIE
ncbi:MAG: hypothetical protein JSV88_18755 [Candidatus Aminicenantes bacterium]|nr:MAG: hypothetical protein JSV88_18755 [Candidatus Aminicenantes bacterium]